MTFCRPIFQQPARSDEADDDPSAAHFAQELIHARQTVLPKRLIDPGPSAEQLHQIVLAASAAPDHGKLVPCFVLIPASARYRLAKVFEDALLSRDPQATPEQLAQAAEKAYRAPTLILAIAKTAAGETGIDSYERMVSIGCAIQNMLLTATATAMGFGSALTSGKALRSTQIGALFSLGDGEVAVCFLSIGSVSKRKFSRIRPEVPDYLTTLPNG
jgi:nitroreductase